MSQAPILYIEDEEDYQILVKRILGHAGLEVVTADTGEAGLTLLRQRRPSMLILDINLPDTDGYKICHQLRQDPAFEDLPILMLTVRRRPDEWLRGFSSGANDYISKPLNPPELVERVVNCLEGKSQRFTDGATAEYQLVRAACAGNRAAFEVLIQKYRQRLIESLSQSISNPMEAEDLVSQAFVYAYEQLGSFRGEASFYTWIYRIAMNKSMEKRKRDNVSIEQLTSTEDRALPMELTSTDSVHDALADDDSAARIHQVLALVAEPYRELLEMFFLKDLTYEQIAKKLDVPVGTVMSRMFKARELLREAWKRMAARGPIPA